MTYDASTPAAAPAKQPGRRFGTLGPQRRGGVPFLGAARARRQPGMTPRPMSRMFLIVVALGVLVLAGAVLLIGAFPPEPAQHAVQKIVPNDKFQPEK